MYRQTSRDLIALGGRFVFSVGSGFLQQDDRPDERHLLSGVNDGQGIMRPGMRYHEGHPRTEPVDRRRLCRAAVTRPLR